MDRNGSRPSLNGVPNQEAYLRMNFLYQAATNLLISASLEEDCNMDANALKELSRFYVYTIKEIAQKLVIRMYVNRFIIPFCS